DALPIFKRRGYIAAPQMASLLQAIIDDPSPGPSIERAGRPAGSPAMQIDAAKRAAALREADGLSGGRSADLFRGVRALGRAALPRGGPRTARLHGPVSARCEW